MKQFLLFISLLLVVKLSAQDISVNEKYPVFLECQDQELTNLKSCFNTQLAQFVFDNFKVPEKVLEANFKGAVPILFEVDAEGVFKVLYVDASYQELKEEVERVFSELPKVEPASYDGRPTFKQFTYNLQIPLGITSEEKNETVEDAPEKDNTIKLTEKELALKREFDSVTNSTKGKYQDLEYSSELNIPFTHQFYAKFGRNMNLVGTNSHTAAKPFLYSDVSNYYDLKAEKDSLLTYQNNKFSQKLWNERLVQIQSDKYWFTIDPIFDLQLGKDTDADFGMTYNNTRGLLVQGGLGKRLSFSTSVYESQGRFAQYFNRYAETLKAFGPDPAIIPGRGIAKRFKTDAYDYPVAEAYLSYSPTDFLNIQFGHGKNFIGDGYRSLFQSDVASPYPFLKLNTKFWKIKYTNTWMWLKDVRPEVAVDKAFLTKYMANHYLSWNVSKRLNLGFFESVLWTDTNNRGFDINYLNPIIFFRAIEFETGQGAGNAIVGASAKYKWNDNINIYSQFILDEFSLNDIKAGNQSWKNKFGYQIGAKYYNAFKIENLMLQLEYNRVRPFTYSHNTIVLNFAHNNQSMAHLWGANFSEFIAIGRYHYKRWFGDAKLIFGKRGFDFNTGDDTFNYGGDIFRSENDRNASTGIAVGQGNTTNIFHAEFQGGYVINPATNLKLFAYLAYRNFNPQADTASTFKNSTLWFSVGLRTDLFNWYFDF